MRISHGNAVRAGFTIALIILCGISFLSFRTSRVLNDATKRAAQTRELLERLDDLLTEILEAESAARGYVMAGRDFYLEPYYTAIGRLQNTRRELQAMPGSTAIPPDRLRHLDDLVNSKIEHTAIMIAQRQSQGLEPAQEVFFSGRGHELMDRIRDEVNAIRSEERANLQLRESESRRDSIISTVTLVVGSLLSLAILSSIFFYLRQEITRSERAADALRESEERFRQMAENIEEVFWMTNADLSELHYISPTYAEVWGRACDSLYANPLSFLDGIHPDDRDGFALVMKERASLGLPWSEEYRIVRPDGSVRWVWDRSFPIQNQSGRIYRYAGITQDITERKRAEEKINELNQSLERRVYERTAELGRVNRELALRNQEVERANRMKSEFLARMSHELRTPLNAIIGFSDLLAEERTNDDSEKRRRFLGHIRDGARHLLDMINDILDVSKIEAGRIELSVETFSAGNALAEVMSILKPLATTKKIRVECRVDPDISLRADRVRFKQILYNLLSNAVKFTPDGGEIEIESSKEDEFIALSVKDNGIGIAPAEQEAIFEEFHQVSAAANGPATGTGLGLAITRRLVELHGGRIWVESKPGAGSRFVVRLPVGTARSVTACSSGGVYDENDPRG